MNIIGCRTDKRERCLCCWTVSSDFRCRVIGVVFILLLHFLLCMFLQKSKPFFFFALSSSGENRRGFSMTSKRNIEHRNDPNERYKHRFRRS